MTQKLTFVFGFLLLGFNVHAQDKTGLLNSLLNLAIDNSLTPQSIEDLETQLRFYLNHPLSLNHCQKYELMQFPGVDAPMADSILAHKQRYGAFVSKYELMAVAGLPLDMAIMLSMLTSVNAKEQDASPLSISSMKQGNHELSFYTGYSLPISNQLLQVSRGNALQQIFRYRYTQDKQWYWGLSMEKDAGEAWGKTGDFTGFHFFKKGKGLVQQLALGDFTLSLAGGLSINANGLNRYPLMNHLSFSGIKPYKGVAEYGFKRGLGVRLQKNQWLSDMWFSVLPMSSSAVNDSMGMDVLSPSLQMNGLHRTASEIANRHNTLQLTSGIHYMYTWKQNQWGLIMQQEANIPNRADRLQAFKLMYSKAAYQTWNGYYHYAYKNILALAEISFQRNGSKAYLLNGLISLGARAHAQYLYTYYSKNYLAPVGSNRSPNTQEHLNQAQFFYRPNKKTEWRFNWQWQNFAGPKYLNDYPGITQHLRLGYVYKKSKSEERACSFHFFQSSQNNGDVSQKLQQSSLLWRSQIHVSIKVATLESLLSDAHVYFTFGSNRNQKQVQGFLFYQDWVYRKARSKWRTEIRLSYFQCEDYFMRIYTLEKDLHYRYATFMAYKTGFNVYLILSYALSRTILLESKINHTLLPNEGNMGSGIQQTPGSNQTQIGFQVLYKL